MRLFVGVALCWAVARASLTLANEMGLQPSVTKLAQSPVLFGMDTLMAPSDALLASIASDAQKAANLLSARQDSMRQRLRGERASYQKQLSQASIENKEIAGGNERMRAGITTTSSHVQQLRKRCEAIQNSSDILRQAVASLSARVSLATQLLDYVPEEVAPLEGNLSAVRSSMAKLPTQGLDETSLLQVSGSKEEPESFMNEMPLLVETLGRIADAESRSVEILANKFREESTTQTAFRAELRRRRAELAAEWQDMNGTHSSLLAAEATLQGMDKSLRDSLANFKAFSIEVAQTMDAAVTAADKISADVA